MNVKLTNEAEGNEAKTLMVQVTGILFQQHGSKTKELTPDGLHLIGSAQVPYRMFVSNHQNTYGCLIDLAIFFRENKALPISAKLLEIFANAFHLGYRYLWLRADP